MTTYEIIPETDMSNDYNLGDPIPQVSISTCRRFCNDEGDCEAFVWSDVNNGTCTLKKNADSPRQWNKLSTLYIKKGNPSYWLLWVFLGILGVLVFLILCRRKVK